MDYRDYNDNELLDFIYENNEQANEIMFKKYEPLIVSIANKIYKQSSNNGLDINDLIQEGMLGLNIAINKYVKEKDVSFYTFAKLCIERRILSAIVSSNRKKHKILNESLSIDGYDDDGVSYTLDSFLSDQTNNPEYRVILNEKEKELILEIKDKLTPFEEQVFDLKVKGFNYKEIAKLLSKDPKSIDNAISRIKKKIKS